MATPREEAIYAFLIKDQYRLEEELVAAKKDVKTWVRRSKLALKAGKLDLGRQAKERAILAKGEFDRIQSELKTVRLKKANLKRRTRMPDASEDLMYAEMLVEQFRLLGHSPEEGEANEIAARMEAEIELEDRKADGEPTPPVNQADEAAEAAEPDVSLTHTVSGPPSMLEEPESEDDLADFLAAVSEGDDVDPP